MGEPGPSGSGNMFQFPSSVLEDPEHFALFQQQLQEAFKQKQMEMVTTFEQAQQVLNLQHLQQYYQNMANNQGTPLLSTDSRDSDNNPSSRSSSVSSLLSSSLPQVPTTSRDIPVSQSVTPSQTHPMKLKAEMRSFSGSSGTQTISQHTKDRLKNMIAQRNKEGSQGSLSGTPPHQPMSPQVNVSSPHFEPYRVPSSHHQTTQQSSQQPEFHQLRKVNSEPNLKMRIRAKLLSKGSSPVQNPPTFNYSHPPLKRSDSETSAAGNLPVDALLSANTALAQNLMVPSPSLPNLAANTIPTQLPLDIPSLLAAAQLTPFLSLPSLFQAQLGLGAGIDDSAIDKNKLDPRFPLGLSQNLPVGGYPSLLKQQLRELVLRRKSLVREEQEDDDAYSNSLLSSKQLATTSESAISASATGLTYDIAMSKHECTCGETNTHIEHGGRVQSIWARLLESGLVQKCEKVLAKKASLDQLRLVHTPTYVTFFAVSPTACLKIETSQLPVKSFVQLGCGGIGIDTDTYFNDNSTQLAARIATGSLIELASQVVEGRLKNGFACIRPPGHHAEPDHAMGFCFFNNVAICARQLQIKYPQKCKRIAIIDWDVHHGNGTQQCFEDDPNVIYISLHRHDNGNFYPGTGAVTELGRGSGKGYTINVPFSGDVMRDPEYLAAWRAIVEPVLDQFQPSFILVSAGFDAARNHPKVLGGYEVSAAMFGYMTRQLLNYADGKVVLALEGGYDLESISDAAEQCVKVLVGEDNDAGKLTYSSLDTTPNICAQETIQKVIAIHKGYWPSLTLQHGLSTSEIQWQAIRQQLQNLTMDTS